MHGSVLQNKKYMKFSGDKTVEVIAVSSINPKDPRGAMYEAKNEKGEKVEYYISWPGLTKADMDGLNRSKARSYNKSGGIPYVSIVNPHTLAEIEGYNGGSSGKIMDSVDAAQKMLTKAHGKPIKRKTLIKFRKEETKVRALMAAGDLGKAWSGYAGMAKKTAKMSKPFQDIAKKIQDDLLTASGKKLDELDALVARGETKGVSNELRSLARYLKGTDLEGRVSALAAKLNPPKS